MPLLPWEKTLTCPYNPSHQITRERIQTHLVKCRKNHPETDIDICPYNASHHVPKPELQFHVTQCPDRKIVELAKYSWAMDKPGNHGNVSMPQPSGLKNHEVMNIMMRDENWETEATIKESYKPESKCGKSLVLRRLQGATPSERKKFYASERQRHELIKTTEKQKTAAAIKEAEAVADTETFYSPRPSICRPSILKNDTLRRPTIGGLSERSSIISSARPGSVTSQLLAIINDGKSRRPGSILMSHLDNPNTTNETTMELNTTKDTNDVTNTTYDNLDERLSKLVLGRGRNIDHKNPQALRRPSGLGSFIKQN